MKNNDKSFNYTYSASDRAEIERIREKYVRKEKSADEDKMELLRRLDKSAEKPGMIAAITLGVIGTLLFGLGMCCIMMWAEKLFVFGIIMGVVGIALIICAQPVYNRITKKKREQLASEILRLTDELSKK